jgi:8-oxo-dGTP pyrophosphatase MutT (NUDIX family)
MPLKQKVQCYITREVDGATQLLVFKHRDYPEAGIQVPAGSIEPGESPELAARREAFEESGLKDFMTSNYLGSFHHRYEDKEEERHVFHLVPSKPPPEGWEHTVSAGAEDKGLRFVFYWLVSNEAAEVLSGNQGAYLHYLKP